MVIMITLAYNAQGHDVVYLYNFLSQLLTEVARCLISTLAISMLVSYLIHK
jgi:hypothetical protein